MANNRLTGEAQVGATNNALQAAFLQSAGLPADLQEMMQEELRERLEAQRALRQRKINQALSNAEAAKESMAQKKREQSKCSHRKQDGQTTRLAGQYLPNGQLCLTCQFCHAEFHSPADASLGQVEPPRNLMPPSDEIGG